MITVGSYSSVNLLRKHPLRLRSLATDSARDSQLSRQHIMDFDPFGSLTDEKEPQLLSSNLTLVSNEAASSEENPMTLREEDADPAIDNTLSPVTAQNVDFENSAEVPENGATSQQAYNYETSTDNIETTVWPPDNKHPTSSQFKAKQVKPG